MLVYGCVSYCLLLFDLFPRHHIDDRPHNINRDVAFDTLFQISGAVTTRPSGRITTNNIVQESHLATHLRDELYLLECLQVVLLIKLFF